MSTISTHVLDTALGRPAPGITVRLDRLDRLDDGASGAEPRPVGTGTTDADGRVRDLLPAGETLPEGIYRLTFDTGAYHADAGVPAFYPQVVVHFRVEAGDGHYHVPLLLSPFGYSTYRGS
jgi:5-hydroxyisourate hydrolase